METAHHRQNEEFVQRVASVGSNYPGKWSILQYNPKGPLCDDSGCDEEGYSIEEYKDRLNMLIENNIRVIHVEGDLSYSGNDLFVRNNFYKAVEELLEE